MVLPCVLSNNLLEPQLPVSIAMTEPVANPQQADVCIVCAVPIELSPLVAKLDRLRTITGHQLKYRGGFLHNRRVAVVECGVGADRARAAAHAVIDAYSPKWLFAAGFSGGLSPTLKHGDVVVVTQVFADNQTPLQIDVKYPPDPDHGIHVGTLYSSHTIVRTKAEKHALATTSGAITVDQETYAVAQVAKERGVKMLAVRVISDDADTDLPSEIAAFTGPTGAVRWGAIAGTLLKRPNAVSDLWSLRGRAIHASERLSDFLETLIKQLPRG